VAIPALRSPSWARRLWGWGRAPLSVACPRARWGDLRGTIVRRASFSPGGGQSQRQCARAMGCDRRTAARHRKRTPCEDEPPKGRPPREHQQRALGPRRAFGTRAFPGPRPSGALMRGSDPKSRSHLRQGRPRALGVHLARCPSHRRRRPTSAPWSTCGAPSRVPLRSPGPPRLRGPGDRSRARGIGWIRPCPPNWRHRCPTALRPPGERREARLNTKNGWA